MPTEIYMNYHMYANAR